MLNLWLFTAVMNLLKNVTYIKKNEKKWANAMICLQEHLKTIVGYEDWEKKNSK